MGKFKIFLVMLYCGTTVAVSSLLLVFLRIAVPYAFFEI